MEFGLFGSEVRAVEERMCESLSVLSRASIDGNSRTEWAQGLFIWVCQVYMASFAFLPCLSCGRLCVVFGLTFAAGCSNVCFHLGAQRPEFE